MSKKHKTSAVRVSLRTQNNFYNFFSHTRFLFSNFWEENSERNENYYIFFIEHKVIFSSFGLIGSDFLSHTLSKKSSLSHIHSAHSLVENQKREFSWWGGLWLKNRNVTNNSVYPMKNWQSWSRRRWWCEIFHHLIYHFRCDFDSFDFLHLHFHFHVETNSFSDNLIIIFP